MQELTCEKRNKTVRLPLFYMSKNTQCWPVFCHRLAGELLFGKFLNCTLLIHHHPRLLTPEYYLVRHI